MNNKELMNRAADNIRILAASMVEKANSGHPGGAMGGADFINVLFSEFLVYVRRPSVDSESCRSSCTARRKSQSPEGFRFP